MAVPQQYVKTEQKRKGICDETLNEVRSLDIKEFAQAMGDTLFRQGQWWMSYKNGGERRPSVGINPRDQKWSDFTREGVGGKDVLSYYAYRKYDNTDLRDYQRFEETVRSICEIAGIPFKYKDGTVQQPTGERRVRAYKENDFDPAIDAKADDRTLDLFYRALCDLLSLTDGHMRHLMDVRGLSKREIELRSYKSISDNLRNRFVIAKELIELTGSEPEGVPGFIYRMGQQQAPYWTLVGRNGFLIPFRNIYNRICGFQLRVDDPYIIHSTGNLRLNLNNGEVEVYNALTGSLLWRGTRDQLPLLINEGKVEMSPSAKYVWLSTQSDKARGILKGARIGFPTPAPYHVAVPSKILAVWQPGKTLSNLMNTKRVWWGEGPMKADIATEYTEDAHLHTAGVANYEELIQPTIDLEAEEVILAFDADSQSNKSVGQSVLRCIEKAREVLIPRGVKLKVALWNEKQAKGIDDLVLLGVKPHLFDL